MDMLLAWSLLGLESWISGSENPLHTSLGSYCIQSRQRVWKRLQHVGRSDVSLADCKRRRYDQQGEGYVRATQDQGGMIPGASTGPHVGRILDGNLGAQPFQVVPDGDLLYLIDRMLQLRGLDTVKISKVKGHADDGMVLDGRVRDFDRLGNNAADEAADFGRRRVPVHVIDARRNLVGVCNRWYPVIRHLHRFFCCYC